MLYDRISSLAPIRIQKTIKKELEYLDINISEKSFIGFVILYGFLLSAGLAINSQFIFGTPAAPVFLIIYAIFFVSVYLWLSLTAESKGKFVESILPDALQLVASNMKSGLTADRALLISARKEFGPLEKELKEAAKRIIGGQTLDESLMEISKKIKSVELERTLWLIAQGIHSGGQIADLLIELSNNLRQKQELDQEIAADISIYTILIFAAAAIGAPMLFGISSFIVKILAAKISGFSSIGASALAVGGGSGGFASSFIQGERAFISPDFVLFFSMVSLVTTSIFASLTIGVISSGKEESGAKYIPIILMISFGIFFLVRWFLGTFFSNLV